MDCKTCKCNLKIKREEGREVCSVSHQIKERKKWIMAFLRSSLTVLSPLHSGNLYFEYYVHLSLNKYRQGVIHTQNTFFMKYLLLRHSPSYASVRAV